MSDWDTVFGEAALGLDLAKVDAVRDSLGHALASHGGRSSVLTQPRPPRERPAEPADPMAVSAGPGAHPVLQLAGRPAAVRIDPDTIFRQEALEFRARGHDTHRGVVRLGTRWVRWGYRITVAALAASIAGTLVIHTSESASGPAVVDGRTGTVAALLPAAAGPDLASSRGITVTLPGGRAVQLSSPHAELADGATIRRAGLVPPAQPAILVTGRLSSGASGPAAKTANLRTEASVVLRSESLASVLARQFKSMLGQGTSP
jgi:hypothetical protein